MMLYMGVKPKILAIYGMSAAGKDTLMSSLLEKDGLNKIVLTTSRPKRDNEIDGRDYFFKKKKEILRDRDNYLWPIEYNDWIYAINKNAIKEDEINVGVFNPYWMTKLFEDKNEHIDLMAIEVLTSDKTRLMRSLTREERPDCDEICRRFIADKADFSNLDFACAKNHFQNLFPHKSITYLSELNYMSIYHDYSLEDWMEEMNKKSE